MRAESKQRHERHATRSGLALFALLAALGACGDDTPKHATVVEPEFDAPCRYAQCSDHGECAPADQGGPMCLCNVGYAGASCTSCEPGFHVDALMRCAPDRSCEDQSPDPCGIHGGCNDSDGVIMCDCDSGYEGPRCTLCESGYGRSKQGDCLMLVIGPDGGFVQPPSASDPNDPIDMPTDPNTTPAPALCTDDACDGHGECEGKSGSIECACSDGYTGDRCASCAADFHRDAGDVCVVDEVCGEDTCSGHGACAVVAGVTACTCDAEYAGNTCAACAPGFHVDSGTICVADQECRSTTCDNHGACTSANSMTTCACADHYTGTHCESCTSGYHRATDNSCAVNEVCASNSCEPHGSCDVSTGVIVCACDLGYGGQSCNDCATGYHADSLSCIPNELCQAGSCAPNSVCDESTGMVRCTCGPGYTGDACSACASGYHRDPVSNQCVPFGCEDNPIEKAGMLTFEKVADVPKLLNNCKSSLDMNTDDLEFSSVDGEGAVWACAKSDFYGVATNHVLLSADSRGSAALTFAGQIATLSFDYAAATPLALDILADGKKVNTLSAAVQSHATLALTFEPPVKKLSLHSTGGAVNRIALDNIAYAPPPCEQ